MLRRLVGAGHDVALVVTRADQRRGRGNDAGPSPVKQAASALGIAVSHSPDEILGIGAALGVVVAYGRLIRPPLLGGVELVNVHFSLLPRWRGAAPVERAVLAGDIETGVSLMRVEAGLDTGAVYRRRSVRIGPDETVPELRTRLAELGADMLVEALAEGLADPEEQAGEGTYAEKVTPCELRLDWELPPEVLLRVVRLGRAWTTRRGKRLLVLAAALAEDPSGGAPGSLDGDVVSTGESTSPEPCGRLGLRLLVVQPEGRRPIPASEWLRGARLGPAERLGT